MEEILTTIDYYNTKIRAPHNADILAGMRFFRTLYNLAI